MMRKLLVTLMAVFCSVLTFAATETTVYYAVPSATVGTYSVKCNVNRQGDGNNWAQYDMTATGKTYNSNPIYSCTFTDLYNGLGTMQFQLYDGSTWKSQVVAISSWTSVGTYNGKMWVHGSSSWIAYAEDDPDEPVVTTSITLRAYSPDPHATPKIHYWGDGITSSDWNNLPSMTADTEHSGWYTYTLSDLPENTTLNFLFKVGDAQTADLSTTEDACYDIQAIPTYAKVTDCTSQPAAPEVYNYYLVGSFNGWNANTALPMPGDSIVKNFAAGVYEFKILPQLGSWNGELNANNLNAECCCEGVSANGTNIKITQAADGDVKIKVVSGKICITGLNSGEYVVQVWNVVGDEALIGENWNIASENTIMTKQEDGKFTYTISSVNLAVGSYNWKIVGDHNWSVAQYPQSGNYTINITAAGPYQVDFTLDLDAETPGSAVVTSKAAPITYKTLTLQGADLTASGAKMYAYAWGEKAEGTASLMTMIVEGEDSLGYTGQVNELADSVIFVRMAPEATEFAWEGDLVWNRTGNNLLCETMYFDGWLDGSNYFAVTCEAPLTETVFTVVVPGATDSVFMAGSFDEWGSFHKLSLVEGEDSIYTITLEGDQRDAEYKYLSGPDWKYVEVREGNRTYAAQDTVSAWTSKPVDPVDVVYYVVGSMQGWSFESAYQTVQGEYVMEDMEIGSYEFKVLAALDWSTEVALNTACCSENVNKLENGNIKVVLAQAGDITINVVDGQVCVTGNFVAPVTADYYLVGNMNNWSLENAYPMVNDSITILLEPDVYSMKVIPKSMDWNQALGYSAVDADCSCDGIGTNPDGNIVFTMGTAGEVTIAVVDGHLCITGITGGEVTITSWTVVGDSRLMGENWNKDSETTVMTETSENVFQYTIESVVLTAGSFEWKIVGNHSWNVRTYPSSGNYSLEITEEAKYQVVFTLDLNAETPVGVAQATKLETPVESVYYLAGTITSWDLSGMISFEDGDISLNLTQSEETAAFKVVRVVDGQIMAWYGANGTMTRDNCTNWELFEQTGDVHLTVDKTGLYTFSLTIGEENEVIVSVSYPSPGTGLDAIMENAAPMQKVIYNGQLFIRKDGKLYNVQGQLVR